MAVNFKTLCEVKLLHEFYLTDKDGSNIFDLASQTDRLSFLRRRFTFNYPSVNNHLAYEPAGPLKEVFKNFRLRIVPSYSGFRLCASVEEQELPGNIKAYRPQMPLADNMPIIIQLRKKDTVFESISNSIVKRPIPARYYFTNRNLGTTQLSPVLSRSLPLRNDAQTYEQGELNFDTSDNKVKAFFFEKNGTKNWVPVNGNGYVNGNDLSLLPTSFEYAFTKTDAVNDATFVLKDAANATISTINRTSTTPLNKVSLDYSAIITTALNGFENAVPPPHTLEVTATNGYNKTHSIVFCNPALVQPATWGLVHLQPRVTDPLFHLLDNSGLLITRKNADGTTVPAPVFEIRIKSRFAFWRYVHNKNKKLQDNAALHPFLVYDAARGLMETIEMQNASYTPVEFSHLGATQYLPNPDIDTPLKIELQRLYTDIRVPESDLFKSL
ncbi:MAG TPA: hypothetical protein VD993_15600 [Chitinophagaceae bacterium]|nr:hypothetical protein [Chitinophagaceae bacterium]